MIEVNSDFAKSSDTFYAQNGSVVCVTPPIDDQYFLARVPLFKDQAIVIFPKFFTLGCGFAQEEDWNTNLPLSCEAQEIYDHIRHNKKYTEITDQQCLDAIKELQQWAKDNKTRKES